MDARVADQDNRPTLPARRKPSTVKRMLVMLAAVLVLVAAIAYGFYRHVETLIASAPKPTPATVSSTKVEALPWQKQIVAVGNLSAVNGVDLSTEVPGIVDRLHVRPGDTVKLGDAILELNTDPEKASLASLDAAAKLSAKTLARDQDLLARQVVSQATVDADTADLESKLALVDQQRALIAQKTVRAPFAGDIGIINADLGQYLAPGTVFVTLQDLGSLYVDFLVPQGQVGLLALGQTVTVSLDAFPDKGFPGVITAIDPKLDPNTRNVKVRATLANPEKLLRPGMFVRAAVDIGKPVDQLTLPRTAITFNSYGSTVFVIKPAPPPAKSPAGAPTPAPGLVVEQIFVTTGDTRGDQIAVTKGLTAGEEVVTSGQLKLKTGAPVVVDNSVKLPDDPNPKPQER